MFIYHFCLFVTFNTTEALFKRLFNMHKLHKISVVFMRYSCMWS